MHGSRSWALAIVLAALVVACFPPARSSHAAGGGSAASRAELQSKVERVRNGMQQMRARGEDVGPIIALMQDVPNLVQAGRIDDALAHTDRALAIAEAGGAPDGATGPSPPVPDAPPPPRAPSAGWRHASREPVIDILRRPVGLPSDVASAPLTNWNDPSVMKEGDHYTMWASLGMKGGGKGVSIWKFTSRDGLSWRVVGSGPVLEPGGLLAWDSYGVETPAVIRVGGTYHMYYTAYKHAGGFEFTMGHATSPDGDHWEKQGELTSLTKVVGAKDGNPWGWLARAEPTAVYVDGAFWLYFTDVHCRVDGCKGGSPLAQRGISLAKSRDGQSFTQVGTTPVLLQSASYPASEGWEGYSTPWVLHDGTLFHLFADLFRQVGDKHYQTRIAHYESSDGVHFREVEADVVQIEGHPWATKSVRAPSVIIDGGRFLMWYAGDNFDQSAKHDHMLEDIRSGRIRMGIAMMTSDR